MDFFKTTFCDQDGKLSAKRCTLFAAVLMMVEMTIGDQYFEKHVQEFIYSSWQWIVISGIGFVGIEKYMQIYKGKKNDQDQQ